MENSDHASPSVHRASDPEARSLDPDPESFLIEDFHEACAHYRHLESTRTKYLGFFTSVILASLGLLMALLRDVDEIGDWVVVGLYVFGMVLLFVTGVLLSAVRKTGFVLQHYADAQRWMRDVAYGALDVGQRREAMALGFYDNPQYNQGASVLRVHALAEFAMRTIGVAIVAMMLLGLFGVMTADTRILARVTTVLVTAVSLAAAVRVLILVKRVTPPQSLWPGGWQASQKDASELQPP